MVQQQENVEQKRNERIRNARSSLTTTKKVLGAFFICMWVTRVTNFNVMDSLRHENDSILPKNIEFQLKGQKTQLQLDYIDADDDADDDADISTKIVGNSGVNVTNREDNAGRQESRNIYSKKEEHSQHQYCAIGLKVSRLVMEKYLLVIGWIPQYVLFHYLISFRLYLDSLPFCDILRLFVPSQTMNALICYHHT